MSKQISFGFNSKAKPPTSKPSAPKPISLPSTIRKPLQSSASSRPKPSTTLNSDSDSEEDRPPKHEALTGFSASGTAILSQPTPSKTDRIIANPGNSDWRKRGKNLLPSEVQGAQQQGNGVVTVEKDEVSNAYGLQFAEKHHTSAQENGASNGDVVIQNGRTPQTDDARALAALLSDGTGEGQGTATIAVQGNEAWQRNETDDFRADVALRPDSSTLDEYAAMPVEEFGMAMLRGMGKKRRANGEVIAFNQGEELEKKRKERTNQGLLGIGAKPVKGLEGAELGAWGKGDMRKNARGEGFFTPVLIEDQRTGERISEEELERRKRAGKEVNVNRDEKRERESGENGDQRRERDRNDGHRSKSRREEDKDRDYGGSRSHRDRSRSRDRRRKDNDDYENDSRDRERRRDRDRDRYGDGYRDSKSHRSEGRHRYYERNSGRDRDRERDDRNYKDRQRH